MRIKLLLFIFFFTICSLFSNVNAGRAFYKEYITNNTAAEDIQPKFPGGEDKLKDYITKNLKYPVPARENKIQGTVYVSFIVETDGTLSNIKVTEDIGYGCGEAALELVKNMPKWKPGKRNDEVARMGVNIPIRFYLEN